MRRVYIALVAACAAGCGSRVSLGAVGDDADGGPGATSEDGGKNPFEDGGSAPPDATDSGDASEADTPIDGGSPYDPCAAKKCGDTCKLCNPADSQCVETAVVKQCTAEGKCTPGAATCT